MSNSLTPTRQKKEHFRFLPSSDFLEEGICKARRDEAEMKIPRFESLLHFLVLGDANKVQKEKAIIDEQKAGFLCYFQAAAASE